MFVIYRPYNFALGDHLLASLLVSILRDQNIDAYFWSDSDEIRELVDCPIRKGYDYRFVYEPEQQWDGRSIMQKALDNCQTYLGITNLKLTRTVIPVKYHDLPQVPQVDVAICSSTGFWSKYRNWPYFEQLKHEFDRHGITWIELGQKRGVECLNYVKKAKIYLGLETGVSHYVSSVAKKALIIQSGYSNINYWCSYGYAYIQLELPCSNCFLRNGCAHGHACMKNITTETVLREITKLLI